MGKVIEFKTKQETEYADKEIERLEDWILYASEYARKIKNGICSRYEMLKFMYAIVMIQDIARSTLCKKKILGELETECRRAVK